MSNFSKLLILGALCLSAQGLQADNNGGYRYEGDTYISNEGHYYDRSDSGYVQEEHAQMDRALNRGERYPSITTYSPEFNPQNAYKDLPSYRGDNNSGNNYAPQAQQCGPNGCYQRYQDSTAQYQQQYPSQANSQGQSREDNLNTNGQSNRGYTNSNRADTNRADNDIAQNIRSEISHDDSLSQDAKSVQVDVSNSKVTLTGTVQNNGEKTKIENLARSTDGVTGIINKITVK